MARTALNAPTITLKDTKKYRVGPCVFYVCAVLGLWYFVFRVILFCEPFCVVCD